MSHDYSEQLSLLALDAIPDDELGAIEDHVNGCAECQTELEGLRHAAASLIADQPPSDLTWRKIQSRIAAEPAVSASSTRDTAATAGTSPWAIGVAAAAALVLGVVGAQLLSSDQLGGDAIVAAAEQAADDSGSIVGEFLVEDDAVARIVVTEDGQGYVIPAELEPLDSDRTYQLWVLNDKGEAVSAGVLGSDPDPATFTWTAEITGFALTREVAGGVISSAGDVVSVITDV